MAIAIALFVIVVGSVLFHVLTPWWVTPIASNWSKMDHTLAITVIICGIFFVVINLFVVYTLWRFRHREGARAAYEPENHKLERWLIGITTVGIVALLAPGLVVYADYVTPPDNAMVLEVVGQQWQWRFRFPGEDGKLGGSDARFVKADNPLGLDPADKAGQDDIVVLGNEVHLPVNKPVKVLLRSHDALHDFYVPHFRARMNIVPGMVSSFWFTPTQVGKFESMCAQLCGVGHPNMRGLVVVEEPAGYQAWLARQTTFQQSVAAARRGEGEAGNLVGRGQMLAQSKGCVACHSVDGSKSVGPTWKDLLGKTEHLEDGTSAVVDEAFLARFIRDPKPIKGFPPVMPKMELSDDELAALVAYIKSLKG
ncbi:c-type cytochrome [Piscinibacter sp. XHJ-5]|uniref:c-type cytochrome n=1 Tax=Piscinibacter sp. XHJ-5 TaxID=3037797 RepID=UPI0024529B6E|nr:c-type cytochrome [Piscinibacter sp. XHJ-5]